MTNSPASNFLGANDSELLHLRRSFIRHLAADRRTPATRNAYGAAIVELDGSRCRPRRGARWPR